MRGMRASRIPFPAPLAALAALAAAGAGGCLAVEGEPLQELSVQSARIDRLQLCTAALIGGGSEGKGLLLIEDTGGGEHEAAVELRGGTVGFVMDISWESPIESLQLELPEPGLSGDQLLGRYRGNSEAMVVVVGVEVRHLGNEHGVRVDQPFFGLGVNMMVAFEWLDLALDDGSDDGEEGCQPW